MNRISLTIISFFLALTLGLFLVYPQYQELRLVQMRIREKNHELESKENYLSELRQVSEEIKEHEDKLLLISSALPADVSLPALFSFLQKTSSQNGLALRSLQYGGSSLSPESEIKENRISFQAIGSYASFKNFIQSLERSARLIEVDSISFSSPEEELGPFTFSVTIKVYSY